MKKANDIPKLYAISNFQPKSSAFIVGEDKLLLKRFIAVKIIILAIPRKHWNMETKLLSTVFPPDITEWSTSAETPKVTDNIIMPLMIINIVSI